MRRLIPAVLVLAVLAVGCATNPFYKAIKDGNFEKIRAAVEADPAKAVDILENEGYPLDLAVSHHEPDIVRYLLSKGADPNFQYERNGLTPLMNVWPNEVGWMLEVFKERISGDHEIPKPEYILILLETANLVDERLIDVRAAGYDGDNTALILLKEGADINAVDVEGRNALWYILQRYGPVTVQLLLEEGIEDLDQCVRKIASDLTKMRDETITREDLTPSETYWIDYEYYSPAFVVRFAAFSRQLSLYLIEREMRKRAAGVETIVK